MRENNSSESNLNVRDVFLRAQGLPAGPKRDTYLEEIAASQPELVKDVRSLLGTEVDNEAFLRDDIAGKALDELDDQIGTVIDKYRILEKLGEGGFGEVFRVEQTEPIRRELALKLIKPGMDSREIISRFEAERQALALLDHPNIASIHDAGKTESGHPYFVMELAVGEPITRYCDTHQLSIPKRLQLFQQVCSAVQHAHQKGILHRDLKPSNIVVVEQDGEPMPKIIDFGITKSLQSKLTDHTVVSQRAVFLGTPAYMSPEQLDLGSENLDTRTDVYALGVVLYELLAGDRPFDRATLDQASFPEVHRVIREVEPPKPSTRVHTLGDTLETVAKQRLTESISLERTLRGDLDWIVMKAIDKDRGRRYQGAALLSQDISRYLEHKPVEASPPSKFYLMRKFVRRHRLGVTAAALVFLALVSGLTLATVSYRREARQRFLAEESRSRSQELLSYIQSEVQPKLDAAGRRDANLELAKATIRHYEGLPPELYDHSAMREHAKAYKQLQNATQWNFPNSLKRPLNDTDRINNTMSAPLWRQVADADPNDVEAVVEAYVKERRSERYAKEAAGEWKGAIPKEHVMEKLRTLRELEKRYPDSKEVQFYMIRVCRGGPFGLEERKDSVERAERLIERYPEDDRFRSEHLASVLMLAYEYRSSRQVEQALATLWKGWNTVEGYLKEQPSHWGFLTAARYFGSDLLTHVSNEKQMARLASSARNFIERLRILDPSEPYWHWQASRFTFDLAVAAWLDRQPGEAYSILMEAFKCLEDVAPQYWDQGMDWDRFRYHSLAGMAAAGTDDRETARAHLHTLETEFEDWVHKEKDQYSRSYRKCQLLFGQLLICEAFADWTQFEAVAETLLDEVEKYSPTKPDKPDQAYFPAYYRARTHAFLGKARHRQLKYDEALFFLEKAHKFYLEKQLRARRAKYLQDFGGIYRIGIMYARSWEVAENLAGALQATGHEARALELLEWSYQQNDQWVRDNDGLLESRLRTARVGWLLAQALDPNDPKQAERRREVLHRAAELLDDPENEERFSAEEREIQAQIEEMLKKDHPPPTKPSNSMHYGEIE